MAAVIGLAPGVVEDVLRRHDLESLMIANRNAPQQLVLSGPVVDIERAGAFMEEAGARAFVPLQVSAAFHSAYMFEAQEVFALFLERFEFRPMRCTVISNVTARPYPAGASSEQARALLAQQMTRPVLWTDSVAHLLEAGATEFVEVGPGKVLTKLVGQIQAATPPPLAQAV
jgi:malonyl CoA-acyl carrier protein transacylase